MSLLIPLTAVPNQSVQVTLNGQTCRVAVYQKDTGLYIDLYVGTALIIAGVICQHANRIVRDSYLGFTGDLAFIDTQGVSDPDYTGIGTRYVLVYLAPGEY